MKNRILVLVVLLGTLTAFGPSPAQAEHEPTPRTCSAITSLNCTSTMTNVIRGGYYCQRLDDSPPRCELYWPFRNPTVNAHAALGDPDAFPVDYLPAKARAERLDRRVDVLQERLDRKNARIKILRKRVERLRNR